MLGATRQLASSTSLGCLLWLAACGETAPPPEPEPPAASSGGETLAEKPGGGMAVEGILGTIPQRKIEETMSAKLPALQRCFFEGMGEVEYLAGHIKFYFRVGLDGRVEWVHPRGSTVGHRGTERCLLGVAEKTRFPEPKGGGPAEFVWGFELEGSGGVRAPVAWEESRVETVISEQRAGLATCSIEGDEFVVTAYVAPGGSVVAAGAAVNSQPGSAKIDCVLDAVRSWKMPDPGSYAAKVSFRL